MQNVVVSPIGFLSDHMEVIWDLDFWKAKLDRMARHRYNTITMWNQHPFPSMVKVEDYPDVALSDVQRSTVQWEEHYSLQGRGFCEPEIINNVETLATIPWIIIHGSEQFAALDPACEFRSLLTFPVLLEVAKSGGYLPEDQIELLADWRQDPFGWGEKHGFPRVE